MVHNATFQSRINLIKAFKRYQRYNGESYQTVKCRHWPFINYHKETILVHAWMALAIDVFSQSPHAQLIFA